MLLMNMRSSTAVAIALGLAAIVGGCTGSDTAAARYASVRDNPTPELDTLYQRPVEVDNKLALTEDENWRMFTQDLGRFWYTDRPSRLTREPVPR
jgi:hypothetical protein